MNDTEVRAALQKLADRVPPSEDPWTEHERRLAARSRSNRRWLAAGAAACVLVAAGIAVPVLLNRDAPSPGGGPAGPSVATIGPVRIEDGVDGGFDYWGIAERRRDPLGRLTDSLCLLPGARTHSPTEFRQDGQCRSAAVTDHGPAAIHPAPANMCEAEVRSCRSGGLVILTAPTVAQLEVELGGHSAPVRELGRTGQLALFQAAWPYISQTDLRGRAPRYVARDADGRIIDDITFRGREFNGWYVPPGPRIGPVDVVEYFSGARLTYAVSVKRTPDADGNVTDSVCESTTSFDKSGAELGRNDRPCVTTPVEDDGPARLHPMAQGICDGGRFGRVIDCALQTGVVVVATAPKVARLDVAGVGGDSVRARELGRTDRVALFVADFMRTAQPKEITRDQRFVYTAYDADGRVIDEVTLSANDVRGWR